MKKITEKKSTFEEDIRIAEKRSRQSIVLSLTAIAITVLRTILKACQ